MSHAPRACSTGTQCASLSQGVYEAAGRRYVLVWKMLNEVMIVSLVPAGASVLTAARLNGAVAQLLLIYCKATQAVRMDAVFRKYVQARTLCHEPLCESVCLQGALLWRDPLHGRAQMQHCSCSAL